MITEQSRTTLCTACIIWYYSFSWISP